MKKIFLAIAIFLLNISVALAAINSVNDSAGLLRESDIQKLNAQISQVEQKHGVRIGINFLQTVQGHNVNTVNNELLRKYYSDAANGGINLLIVMEDRSWNIALDAKLNQRILSYNDVAYLNDGFMDKLHNDNFAGAAEIYVKNIDELLTYYEQHGAPFDRTEQFNPMALGAAILIALILGFLIRSWLIGSMSNVHNAVTAGDYLKRDTINLTNQRDTYLFTNVSRRTKSKSNGGRSSGGGGSSGGGHF